jgi:hypothetical protein
MTTKTKSNKTGCLPQALSLQSSARLYTAGDANQGAGHADHICGNGAGHANHTRGNVDEFAQDPLSLPSGLISRLRANVSRKH